MAGSPGFTEGGGLTRAALDDCVHCGFCLPTCPTYRLWGQEMDSPRGRIQLMKAGLDGLPLDLTTVTHLDACLSCHACVTACPSGVAYGDLIEGARAQIEQRHRRPLRERIVRGLIFRLFPYPRRLRWAARPLRWLQRTGLLAVLTRSRLLDRLMPRLAAMQRLAPPVVAPTPERLPLRTAAVGRRRLTVGLLTGCVQSVFFPGVNAATVRVLAAEGCDVVVPPNPSCCGALSLHLGRDAEARRMARATITAFDQAGCDGVVVNAAGCGSAMKGYVKLLADDPEWAPAAAAFASRVCDVSELLAGLGTVAQRWPLAARLAYHDACHLAHAQGIRAQPRALLEEIPGLELAEIADADICCGSAGVYNILQPEPARELGARKATAIVATGADAVVSANPGCIMQLSAALAAAGAQRPVVHLVEVLDASISGRPVSALATAPPAR